LDTFLGDPAYLGQGHAAGYLRQRATELCKGGAPCVVVDPDPENTRAVATYAKAGFAGDRIAPCEDGDPVRIMLFHR
ncbi:MAG: GNAT family N-acetyltransferase, partial [Pseudomonadota bacterium]